MNFLIKKIKYKAARFLNDLSIRKKLILIVVFIYLITFHLANYVFRRVDLKFTYAGKVEKISTLAEIIGYNCEAAISFDDVEDAETTLKSLTAEQNIERAVVYRNDFTTFALYSGPLLDGILEKLPLDTIKTTPDGHLFFGEDIFVKRSITREDSVIGYIVMQAGLWDIHEKDKYYAFVAISMTLISVTLSILLASLLQHIISRPIIHLSRVARIVEDKRDYTVRAKIFGKDEIGHLTIAFNDMLSEINERDSKLRKVQADLIIRSERLQQELIDRHQAESETAYMRGYLQNVIDAMPSFVAAVDEAGKIQHWNLHAEQITGIKREDAHQQPFEDIYPHLSFVMELISNSIRLNKPEKRERIPIFFNEKDSYVDIMIYPLSNSTDKGAVMRIDDVTERFQLEEMMIQTEKMMSIGGLAGGMAHEINNPLGIIMQSSQNILRRISVGMQRNAEAARECDTTIEAVNNYLVKREIHQFLTDINDAGLRAARIVTNMLNFSRKSESDKKTVNLAELIRKSVELAASDYDLKKKFDFRKIEIEYYFEPDLPNVLCYQTKIQQVLLNLLRNAAQALAEKCSSGSPRITIRTRREKDMAIVEISDNGPGMNKEVSRRIFEPFYTTKDIGTGTGLGLSVSYFIITNNHNGRLSVESEIDRGSTFRFALPL